MNIFLDDIRTIEMSHNQNKGLGDIDFVIVRNYKDFIELVDDHILDIKLVSFDHDLADFEDGVEFTGKNAADYLIDKCQEVGRKFPDWYVHSDNTSGRENIIKLILNYMKVIEGLNVSDFRYFHKGFYKGKFVW